MALALVIGGLLLDSVSAILQIIVVSSLGTQTHQVELNSLISSHLQGFALQHSGWVHGNIDHVLSKLNYYVLLPALFFRTISSSITLQELPGILTMVFLGVVLIFFQLILGYASFNKIFKFDELSCRLYRTALTFNNSGMLVYIIVGDLLGNERIFGQDAAALAKRAISYTSFFVIPFNALMFSLGLSMMTPSLPNTANTDSERTYERIENQAPSSDEPESSDIEMNHSISTDSLLSLPQPHSQDDSSSRALPESKWKWWRENVLRRTFNPSLTSVLAAMVVGLIPPVQRLFILTPPPLVSAFTMAIKTLSNAAFPCLLLALGATFSHSLPMVKASFSRRQPGSAKRINWKAMLLSFLSKYLIVPAFTLGLGILLVKAHLVSDLVVVLVLMVEGTTPPALNLSVLAGMAKNDHASREMSALLFIHYLFSVVPLAVWTTIYLVVCNYYLFPA